MKTLGFCADPVTGNEILAVILIWHCSTVCWQGASAVVLQAEAAVDVMQGSKHDVQLRRKGLSSKENQARLPAVEACQPSQQQAADTSHSNKPVMSRGEPLPLSPSGCFRSIYMVRPVVTFQGLMMTQALAPAKQQYQATSPAA